MGDLGFERVRDESRSPNPKSRIPALQQPSGLVQENVDEHSGDRHVEPDWKRPTRDAHVLWKSAFQSSRGRNERERKHAGRQRHVRDEDREIDGSHYSLPREAYRSDLGVIDDVADEEERGGRERRKHARTMLGDAPRADQGVSRGEKYRRERVEARVDGGEVVDSHGWQRTTLSWQGRRWPTVIPCCKS